MKKINYYDEGNDIYSIDLYNGDRKYIMNSGKLIIDCLNDSFTKDEIIDLYRKKHNKSYEVASLEITNFLAELEMFRIIPKNFKEKLGFSNNYLKNTIEIMGEKDVIAISNYIYSKLKEESCIFSVCDENLEFFCPYSLRSRIFSNKEVYMYLTNENGEINNLIGFQIYDDMPANVILIISEDIDKFKYFMDEVEKYIKRRKVTKIRINCYENRLSAKITSLIDIGYSNEAILKKEYLGNDLIVYSKFI